MLLHHERVQAPGAHPTAAVLFLHGILGSGANLRGAARRLVLARPELLAVLVDLRAHGASLGVEGPDTVERAAADVAQTARTLELPTRAVAGHSFGGKVALVLPEALEGLSHVLTLDSGPGTHDGRPPGEGPEPVVDLLESLHGPWPSREAFAREVEAQGQPPSVGQWLAMSLRRDPDGFRFGLELPRIRALLASYFAVDRWPWLEARAAARDGLWVHLVVGRRSLVYGPAERARAEALAAQGGRVTVDVLDAGHWVHVDAADALHAVLLQHLREV